MWASLDRLAGTSAEGTSEVRWRGRFVASLSASAFIANVLQIITNAALQNWPNVAANVVGFAVIGGWLLLWRRFERSDWQADAFGAFATLIYFASLLFNKDVSALMWLAVTPLICLFIGGGGQGLRWAIIDGIAAFVGVAIIATDAAPAALAPVTSADVVSRVVAMLVVVPMVGAIWDASARSTMAELSRKTEEAQAASREKGRFLANVSHELRTPLHGMLGVVELMRTEPSTPKTQERLELLVGSGRLLTELIDDLLEVTGHDAGPMHLQEETVRLDELVNAALEVHRVEARRKHLVLVTTLEGAALSVRADPSRLQQVVHNLVGNAVKFTSAGTVMVRVVVRHEGSSCAVQLDVKDTGPGISSDAQSKLFQPFSRVNDDHRLGGVGLGLSITRAIVTRLGGSLWVESAVGAGALFCVRLQLAVPEPAPVAETPPSNVLSFPLRLRVLVVDRAVAKGQLEHLGVAVTTAEDGRRAIEFIERETFDLVLMDRHMPECDGLEATRIIREREQTSGGHLPVVGVTASVQPEDLEACRAAGMDEVLTKPLPLERLREVLATYVPTKRRTA
ncbi:MAG: response regulator [Archangiaceae bacterium]|nr:response regulator [Archangiaceae bacterium]